ncbi:MAG: Asp-tRNA(Asn)/Glu-tRNA(Gln) amidotransferase subunit GatB [Candidatus Heimdallarchaeota archaeon]
MKAKVGLEIHVPLPTKTKLFCRCAVRGEAEEPNVNICPTCTGLPGAKPTLNKAAFIFTLKIAKALNCEINPKTNFSRKTYFYPDLPKNFQITQYDNPIAENGVLELIYPVKQIRINRVHLEEDPGSIKYVKDGRILIDYNRSGIALAEIVTQPDFEGTTEVASFMKLLHAYLRYLGIPAPENFIRCDINVSIEDGARVEIKNVSGINIIKKTLDFEINRQIKLRNMDMSIKRATLMFDSDRGITIPLRKKEYEEEYGYIFEPDLPLYDLAPLIESIEIPRLPDKKLMDFVGEKGLDDPTQVNTITEIIFQSELWADALDQLSNDLGYSKKLVNIISFLISRLDQQTSSAIISTYYNEFKGLASLALNNGVPYQSMCDALQQLIKTGNLPDLQIWFSSKKVNQNEIEEVINTFLMENPNILVDMKRDSKVINFAIGQIIKKTGWRQQAKAVHRILSNRLKQENRSK